MNPNPSPLSHNSSLTFFPQAKQQQQKCSWNIISDLAESKDKKVKIHSEIIKEERDHNRLSSERSLLTVGADAH